MAEAKTDPRIDGYIERAAPFAQPILRHLRALVHEGCPDATETMKWNFPHFLAHGRILFSVAAFQRHCAAGFWAQEVADRAATAAGVEAEAMGQLGKITSLDDLPPRRLLLRWVRLGAELAAGGKPGRPRPARARRPEAEVPLDLARELAADSVARAHFESFPPSAREEYLEWLREAKRPETRARRLQQTLEWVAAGRRRNWKHQNC